MAIVHWSVISSICFKLQLGNLKAMSLWPKLFNDAIGEWPNYIRLVLPILYIPVDKKREKSMSSVVQSSDCILPWISV